MIDAHVCRSEVHFGPSSEVSYDTSDLVRSVLGPKCPVSIHKCRNYVFKWRIAVNEELQRAFSYIGRTLASL